MAVLKIHPQKAFIGLPPVCLMCGIPTTTCNNLKLREFVRWKSRTVQVVAEQKVALPVCGRHLLRWRMIAPLMALTGLSGFGVWIAAVVLSISLAPEHGGSRVPILLGGGLCAGPLLGLVCGVGGCIFLAAMRPVAHLRETYWWWGPFATPSSRHAGTSLARTSKSRWVSEACAATPLSILAIRRLVFTPKGLYLIAQGRVLAHPG